MKEFKNQTGSSADRSPASQNNVLLQAYFNQTVVRVIGGLCLCALTFASPETASAGFFSFLLGNTAAAETSGAAHNSQTIPLPAPSIGMGDVSKEVAQAEATTFSVSTNNSAFVPLVGPVGTQADIESGDYIENPEAILYVVRPDETLADIADMFDISTKTILWANDLKSGQKLTAGQTLVILPVSGLIHNVKKGDTLAKIAKKYNADEAVIGKWNGIDEDSTLISGTDILIPDGTVADPVVKKAPTKVAATLKDVFKKATTITKTANNNLPLLARGRTRLILGYDGADLGNYFMRPVAGGNRSQGLHGQNATDIAAPRGTTIVAAAGGVVTSSKNSGFNGGLGNYVSISHPNGTRTYYGHMLKTTVVEGQTVAKGEQIGLIGSTGLATGPHVHFAVIGAKNPLSDNPNYGL